MAPKKDKGKSKAPKRPKEESIELAERYPNTRRRSSAVRKLLEESTLSTSLPSLGVAPQASAFPDMSVFRNPAYRSIPSLSSGSSLDDLQMSPIPRDTLIRQTPSAERTQMTNLSTSTPRAGPSQSQPANLNRSFASSSSSGPSRAVTPLPPIFENISLSTPADEANEYIRRQRGTPRLRRITEKLGMFKYNLPQSLTAGAVPPPDIPVPDLQRRAHPRFRTGKPVVSESAIRPPRMPGLIARTRQRINDALEERRRRRQLPKTPTREPLLDPNRNRIPAAAGPVVRNLTPMQRLLLEPPRPNVPRETVRNLPPAVPPSSALETAPKVRDDSRPIPAPRRPPVPAPRRRVPMADAATPLSSMASSASSRAMIRRSNLDSFPRGGRNRGNDRTKWKAYYKGKYAGTGAPFTQMLFLSALMPFISKLSETRQPIEQTVKPYLPTNNQVWNTNFSTSQYGSVLPSYR